MERAEELMFNATRAQEELFAHLRLLSSAMDTIEKNDPLEKKSTPEKNFSEVEKIRQTWLDEASELYTNEESFNVENLAYLILESINAMNELSKLESSVDQTEKKITFREKIAEKHPELVNEEYLGGCRDCPGDFWNVPYKINTSSCTWEDSDNYAERYRKCRICWDRLYKEDPPRTCRERLQREYPQKVDIMYAGGCLGCPTDYGYLPEEKILCSGNNPHHVHSDLRCTLCWDQDFV